LKSHIISVGLWLYYLQTSLFIYIHQTAVGIVSPVALVNEASYFQCKLWENHGLTGKPGNTFILICVGELMVSVYFTFQTVILE